MRLVGANIFTCAIYLMPNMHQTHLLSWPSLCWADLDCTDIRSQVNRIAQLYTLMCPDINKA